uniref:Methionine aminopeptidase 2 n=1 Tax=Lygus hesperus TaxID=30085 RepID=A0A0A9YTS5_LYGHE
MDSSMEERVGKDVRSEPIQILGINKNYEYMVQATPEGCEQTSPASVPLFEFFKATTYPEGEMITCAPSKDGEVNIEDSSTHATTETEVRESKKLQPDKIEKMRQAAEIHRQARFDIQRFIRPDMSLTDIAVRIENTTRALSGKFNNYDLNRGWGFPTGLSLNSIAAHYTPNTDDQVYLRKGDVLKVDFGTQIDGYIIDSAFTVYFDPKFEMLAKAVQEATETGIRASGAEAHLGDIGGAIQEVMESYEVELDGTTYPVRSIRNLSGHNILPYQIHGGKGVPIINTYDQQRMEEGEVYAIETFGSTGNGYVHENGVCSHYSRQLRYDVSQMRNLSEKARKLLYSINTKFSSLPFCRRWLDDMGHPDHTMALNQLVNANLVTAYPPLVDRKGCYTAQYEHTIYLHPHRTEVLSRGPDF